MSLVYGIITLVQATQLEVSEKSILTQNIKIRLSRMAMNFIRYNDKTKKD